MRKLLILALCLISATSFATIAQNLGGKINVAGVATATVTFTPGTGNQVVCYLNSSVAITLVSIVDNNSNALTGMVANPVVSSTSVHLYGFYGTAITGATSYIASWTTNATASMVCEDYSGVVAVNSALSGNTATGSSATDSITVTTEDANNWVVCGMGEGIQTLTASVGNSRQQVTAGASGKSLLLDNTVVSPGSVTCTATLTSAAWAAAVIELRTSAGASGHCAACDISWNTWGRFEPEDYDGL